MKNQFKKKQTSIVYATWLFRVISRREINLHTPHTAYRFLPSLSLFAFFLSFLFRLTATFFPLPSPTPPSSLPVQHPRGVRGGGGGGAGEEDDDDEEKK